MKRSVSEVLRRGFESVLANWPLLLIRFGESFVMILMVIASIVAMVIPIALSIGVGAAFPRSRIDPGDAAASILAILAANALLILYVVGVILVVVTIWIAVHSFVTAGAVRIYVDSMRQTEALPGAVRAQFDAFTSQRWAAGGRNSWWNVFWIYNIAWSAGAVVMLIPLAALLALVVALRSNTTAAVAAGCGGLVLVVVFMIPVAVTVTILTQRAIVDSVARGEPAVAALSMAWRELRSDLGRHLAVAAVMMVISVAGAMVVGSLSTVASFGQTPDSVIMIPLQFSTSILNSLAGAAIGSWFLACLAGLAVERR